MLKFVRSECVKLRKPVFRKLSRKVDGRAKERKKKKEKEIHISILAMRKTLINFLQQLELSVICEKQHKVNLRR